MPTKLTSVEVSGARCVGKDDQDVTKFFSSTLTSEIDVTRKDFRDSSKTNRSAGFSPSVISVIVVDFCDVPQKLSVRAVARLKSDPNCPLS